MKLRKRGASWQVDYTDESGNRVRKSIKAGSQQEARKQAMMAFKASPLPTHRGTHAKAGMSLSVAYRRAMVEYEPWRVGHQATIAGNYAAVAMFFGETCPLSAIDREAAQRYAGHERGRGLSPSTINQRLSLLSVLLKLTEDWTDGAVRSIKMPRQKQRKGRVRVLTVAEERTVVVWFRQHFDPDMADLTTFLIDTGFRLSEALHLKWADINLQARTAAAWETKADHPRIVPLTKRVTALLECRLSKTGTAPTSGPFAILTKDRAEHQWQRMRTAIGINPVADPEFVLHALRHTCASRLAAEGMDGFRIMQWMGHKQITTTQIYVTLFGTQLAPLAAALDMTHECDESVTKLG